MDKIKELKELVEIEIANLDSLCREMDELLSGGVDKKSSLEVRAAASILHDFYCGIEKIFERVALTMDKSIPSGLNWHTDLLLRMGDPVEGIRNNVISGKLKENLKEYLRFRHLFRHIYGFELKWERIKPLCLALNGIFDSLKREIEEFLSR